MILRRLFGTPKRDVTDPSYAAIVAAARQPKFYATWLVPDTMDGRFDMMVLHMFLLLERLKTIGAEAEPFAQALTDRFFSEMDAALREVGVGDISVGKKVRKMAEAFYGRVSAYSAAIGKNGEGLDLAIARNVFAGGDAKHAGDLAAWMMQARNVLAGADLTTIQQGQMAFE
jgi:cytochrome b pre-mRNA-processing protein 3